jgi:hypothetical protein
MKCDHSAVFGSRRAFPGNASIRDLFGYDCIPFFRPPEDFGAPMEMAIVQLRNFDDSLLMLDIASPWFKLTSCWSFVCNSCLLTPTHYAGPATLCERVHNEEVQ